MHLYPFSVRLLVDSAQEADFLNKQLPLFSYLQTEYLPVSARQDFASIQRPVISFRTPDHE